MGEIGSSKRGLLEKVKEVLDIYSTKVRLSVCLSVCLSVRQSVGRPSTSGLRRFARTKLLARDTSEVQRKNRFIPPPKEKAQNSPLMKVGGALNRSHIAAFYSFFCRAYNAFFIRPVTKKPRITRPWHAILEELLNRSHSLEKLCVSTRPKEKTAGEEENELLCTPRISSRPRASCVSCASSSSTPHDFSNETTSTAAVQTSMKTLML